MSDDARDRVEVGVPFVRKTGVVTEDVSVRDARLRLPLDPDNLNAQGTVHVGAIATLAEAAASAVVGLAFDPARFTFICKAVELRYRRAGRTDLWAKAQLGHEAQTGAEERAWTEGKADLPVLIEVVDQGGERVAEASVTLSLRRL